MTLANQLIDYIEGLQLTQGRFAGQPFKLHGWEKRFIRGAFGTDGDAALIAGICCAALNGPLVTPHAQTVVTCPPRTGPVIMLVFGRRKGEDGEEETYAGAGDQQAERS